MNKDQESLEQLIEAIEDLPRMTLKAWSTLHPEIDQLTKLIHPLETGAKFPLRERLQLELQLRMAKCLTRCATAPNFVTSHHS